MSVFERPSRTPGGKPALWVSYTITEAQRQRFGLSSRTVREPAGVGDRKAADAVERQRRREVLADAWAPRTKGRQGLTYAQYVEARATHRGAEGRGDVHDALTRQRNYVMPHIGEMQIGMVTRDHVQRMMQAIERAESPRTGRRLAPRTVRQLYMETKQIFADAVEIDALLLRSPCTLRTGRGELPAKIDRDPRWRSGALYSRDEAEALMSDGRVPRQRRVLYALVLFMGVRIGEAAGLQWRDWDEQATPLGRMNVATQYEGRALKRHKPARSVPVHAELAAALTAWRADWAAVYGRPPRPDDHIVPTRRFAPFSGTRAWDYLQGDLEVLGLRPRRMHDGRRTFITLARTDGATPDLLRWVTHGPSTSMIDLYSSPPWHLLCAQVSCLRLAIRPTPAELCRVGRPRKGVSARTARTHTRGRTNTHRTPEK